MAHQWYITDGKKEFGPYSSDQIKTLAEKGTLAPTSAVRRGADGKWVRASSIAGLFTPLPDTKPVVKRPAVAAPSEDYAQLAAEAAREATQQHYEVLQPLPTAQAMPAYSYQQPTYQPAYQPMRQPHTTVINKVERAPSNSLGIGSVVLAVCGLFTCWMPIIGLPLAALGLLLGGIAFVIALFRRGGGIGWSIVGTAISVVTLVVAGSFWMAVGKTIDVIAKEAKKGRETVQTIVEDNEPPSPSIAPSLLSPPAVTASNPSSPKPPVNTTAVAPVIEWADSTKAVLQGDVQVRIKSVVVDFVDLKSFQDKERSADKLTAVTMIVTNKNANKKLDFRGWSGGMFGSSGAATLKDAFDNNYKRITFGVATEIVGQAKNESIYPDTDATDVLVFEQPVNSNADLLLELPATAFGGTGFLRFKIPAGSIVRN